jgi:GntR family transcriptional regulator, transcriptional repressor for pyruvate dehydrogenase complex
MGDRRLATDHAMRYDGSVVGKTSLSSMNRFALADQVARELSSGTLAAGDKLPSERELAVRWGVSRPVVREVLRSLEERGLIRVSPGRGAYVREPTASDVVRPLDSHFRRRQATPRDLVEARTMIEPRAAALAAERAEPADLEAILRALRAFDDSAALIERARWDLAFHAAVVRASHNPVIETLFASIAPLTLELMLRSLGDATVSREGVPLHREVFGAIRDRDPDRAREAMSGHLQVAVQMYGNDLDRGLDLVARRALERSLDADVSLEDIVEAALGGDVAREPPVPLLPTPEGTSGR